ncbi:heme-binding protein [Flavobacterium sp.]|uniref:SOUL family heme-binding protein n=1 Tax=Flavobacterium sp. TaxID=239 RepID=UPI002B55E026|nr:heme-binding protein [Flavobacterium sp.]HQA75411.1 heme-binding protein [Flavobacterium sp.]
MKIALVVTGTLVGLFILFQIYTSMASKKTETQAYKVIKVEKEFEIRFYPSTTIAMITSSAKTYKELGSSGFTKLAKYIFGGNNENKQIAMTSPVHMDIGDSISTMAFVMPSNFNKDNLPKPNNSDIVIETSKPEYVAVITFGGFANTTSINKHKAILENALIEKGLTFYGNFRFLGYNPPFQIFGRRNEVIVALYSDKFN